MTYGLLKVKIALLLMGIEGFNPKTTESIKWVCWSAVITIKSCSYCREQNGKIYDINDNPVDKPPVHEYCRCELLPMTAIFAGTAAIDGKNGADFFVKKYKRLLDNYISKDEAKKAGWKKSIGNLRSVIKNAIIGGDVFWNDKGKLPSKPDRIWYEADINYTGGFRNTHRLLFSNDGLIFVTYDHYETFYEIIDWSLA